MTNEAVKLEHGVRNARRYTCDSGTAITKGTLLKLVDPFTASGANVSAENLFAGIAAMDKVAADATTEVSCWVDGIFDLTCGTSGTIPAGSYVVFSGANLIALASPGTLSGSFVGRALETGSANEVIRVAVGSII